MEMVLTVRPPERARVGTTVRTGTMWREARLHSTETGPRGCQRTLRPRSRGSCGARAGPSASGREPVAWSVLGGQPHPALQSRHTPQHQGVSPRARQGHSAVRPAEGDGDQPGRAPAARGLRGHPTQTRGSLVIQAVSQATWASRERLGAPWPFALAQVRSVRMLGFPGASGKSRGKWFGQRHISPGAFGGGPSPELRLLPRAPARPPSLGDLVLGDVTVFPEESPAGAGLRGGGGFRHLLAHLCCHGDDSILAAWVRSARPQE